jgi:hypothetical protein
MRTGCGMTAKLQCVSAGGLTLGGPAGWLILREPEVHLGDDILVPDLAGWRRDRRARGCCGRVLQNPGIGIALRVLLF